MALLKSTLQLLFEKSSASSTKLSSYVEKLTDSIYSTFMNAKGVKYDGALLDLFEPLIVNAASCKRKQMRVRAVQFWNNTFGNNESLQCSALLKNALMHSKTPIKAQVCRNSSSSSSSSSKRLSTRFQTSPIFLMLWSS